MFDGFARCDQIDALERQRKILAARHDPNDFIEYTMKGEGGQSLVQEPGHREWQDIWTAKERAIILGPVGCGKTSQIRGRLLWEIGRDPDDTRIAYISETQGHPK